MSGNANQRPNILNLADRTSVPIKRVARAPMPKKRSKGVPLSERVTLEKVLGLTVRDNRTFACNPATGLVVYPAGCVIVLYNPRRNKQSHIFSHSRKTITALAISSDGKNVVSGEYGHKPAVRVWDVEERSQLAELHGHKFGINCVAFAPNLKYVVSVGEQHDMVVNVWNWKDGSKLAAGKISVKVADLSFSEDGSRFVTAGNRSIRFWYMSSKSKTRETFPLNSRAGLLGEQRNNNFCSVACGLGANQSKTYAVTKSGLLCEFDKQRLLDKWVELRTSSAYSIIAGEEYLFVGCADGIVRLFSASMLNFVATLPRPHSLGVNVSDGLDPSHMITHRENARYPAAIAITYDDVSKKVTCVYNDHSMYVWDLHDVKKIGKQRSFLYHSSCIWGAEVYPSLTDGDKEALPQGSFLTFASDDTIRIWNVDPAMNTDTFKRNIYSNELLKILYVDDQLEHLCSANSQTTDKADSTEGKNGIRCISLSADGQFLASGDRSGNVRVHDMQFMDEVHKIEAHDSEVLCLEFSRPESGYYLLASASRDRLIHVFNMQDDCSLVQTLDDHSSSITAVKFTQCNDRLQMISCGADKALMFRVATQNPDFEFIRNHHVVGKTTIYDLTVDPTEKYVATACQDRNIRIHNAMTGKLKRTYKGSQGEDGTLIKVELDPSGMYIATSSSDKTVAIFDFYSGECVATMDGHSELVTGIKFTDDCKHLISTSGDGCIFVWRLPWGFTHNMKERLNEMGQHMKQAPSYPQLRRGTFVIPPGLDPKVAAIETGNNRHRATMLVNKGSDNVAADGEEEQEEELEEEEGEGQDETDWQPRPKLDSTADLPLWAKKQVCGEDLPSPTTYSNPAQPRGRWAQRLDSKGFKVKSEWDAHRDIELKLEDGIDRRRYTVEPENLAEQVRHFALLQSSSLHMMDADEFVPAEEGLAGLDDPRNASNPSLQDFVTSARGSDPFLPPTGHSASILSPDTPEEELIPAKEEDQEEEVNEVIIYPPSEESSSSPESLKFLVTESTSSLEELQRRRARSVLKKESPRNSRVIQDQDLTHVEGSESAEPASLGTSEDEDDGDEDEAEDDDNEEKVDQDKTPMESNLPPATAQSSTPGQTPTTTSTTTPTDSSEGPKTNGQDSSSPKRDEEEEDEEGNEEESFLHTNYSFTEQEKFGKCLEQLQSGFALVGVSNGNHHRLSISSKFLSRSQLSHIRGVAAASTRPMPSSSVGGVTAQVYLQRRKDVMAKAVDETRRRLQSMGWNSLRSKSTPASSFSGSTTTTTPTPTLTSPNKSVLTSTTASVSEASSKTEASPEQTESSEKQTDSCESVGEAGQEDGGGSQKAQKVSEDGTGKVEKNQQTTESTPVAKQPEDVLALTKDVREKNQKNEIMLIQEVPSKDDMEMEVSKTAKENSSSNEPVSRPAKVQSVKGTQDDGDTNNRSTSPSTAHTDTSGSQQGSQSESVRTLDDQSRNTTPDPSHVPIIKSKRPVSAPVAVTLEAIEKANKENVERFSKYDTYPSRKSISTSSKSKMEKMKARKDPTTSSTMRKTTSMSDLRDAGLDEEPQTESPNFNMVIRSHPRSHSVERKKIRANSPAREKHRSRPDRVLPLVPGLLKPKSYEVGTASSLAKVSTRKDETPPSSPSRTGRGKRSSLGASGEESRQSKSGGSSPETLPETAKNISPAENQSAKDALADKTKQLPEASIFLEGTVTEKQTGDAKDVPKSSSPSSVGSQKDTEVSPNKEQTDKLAMPPPISTTIAKSNRSLRRSSATRVELRQQRRRGSASKTKPPVNDATSTEDQQVSSDSVTTSETSQSDARSSSPRSRAASYRENRSSSLRESLSPKTARKASAPTIEPKDSQAESNPNPSKLKCPNDNLKVEKKSEKSSPRRRRRERNEEAQANASINNNTMTPLDSADKTHSPRSRTHRRRSSETSNASEKTSGVSGDGAVAEEKCETEQRRDSLEPCQTPTITMPSPELESPEVTFDMMKAQVDTMKTAFDQCLELCAKAQGRDSPSKSHQHLLDYFASTFSQMQAASSATLPARHSRRHPNLSVTDDTLSDVSESSLPYDDLLRSASSSSVFMPSNTATRPSGVSPSDMDALRATLGSCRKTSPPNGMTGEGETTSAIALLDQYSSILVSLVRQKIGEEMSEGSVATQTQRSLDSAI